MKKMLLTSVIVASLVSVTAMAAPVVQSGFCDGSHNANGLEIPCISVAPVDPDYNIKDKVSVFFQHQAQSQLHFNEKNASHMTIFAGDFEKMGDLKYKVNGKDISSPILSNAALEQLMSNGQPYTTAHFIAKLEPTDKGCPDTHEIIPNGINLPNNTLLCFAYAK